MYARITRFSCDPARLAEMEARIPAIKAQVAEIDGIANWAAWNEDGAGTSIAIYADEAAANAATAKIQAVWGGLADLLSGPPEIISFTKAENMRG